MRYSKGFSLLEVILVIGVFSVIGLISSDLLTRTYKTSSESDMQGTLKTNGQVAANLISESLRIAESVVCYGPPDNTYPAPNDKKKEILLIRDVSGKYLMLRFVEDPTNTVNGYIAKYENLTPINQGDPAALCSSPPSTSLGIPITDRNPVSGVSIKNGSFNKISSTVGSDSITMKDTVTIIFDVAPGVSQRGLGTTVRIQTTTQVR